ncbi:hypothetical protein FAI40_10490 (plasmid) [Acetobacteraceae bacterium]|nr:hypothetical protein FAI40_10385 [Acetobacteraceae bacterium]QCE35848.1 hypothetical protein FAI40_10490 [Acetobacteraceae bacterium]
MIKFLEQELEELKEQKETVLYLFKNRIGHEDYPFEDFEEMQEKREAIISNIEAKEKRCQEALMSR